MRCEKSIRDPGVTTFNELRTSDRKTTLIFSHSPDTLKECSLGPSNFTSLSTSATDLQTPPKIKIRTFLLIPVSSITRLLASFAPRCPSRCSFVEIPFAITLGKTAWQTKTSQPTPCFWRLTLGAMSLSRAGSSQFIAAISTPSSKSGHLGMPTLFLGAREDCQRNESGYLA